MMTAETGLHCQVRSNLQTEVIYTSSLFGLSLLSVCLDKDDIISGKRNLRSHTLGQNILGSPKSHLTQ